MTEPPQDIPENHGRVGGPPHAVVLASNLWDLSLYADHKAIRGADLPPELLTRWLADAGALFAEIKVRSPDLAF